jgi:tetratricopeptide (TPR) repeat protein
MSEGLDADQLQQERDFLLASLEDLEREHDVGDLDEHDYAALKDDYTSRAARVLRALEADEAPAAPAPGRSTRRTVGLVAVVLLFAVVAGVLVAQSAGRRDPGDVATGGTRQSITEDLNRAGRLLSTEPAKSVEIYDEVLAEDPSNAEALTYKGWALTLAGKAGDGLTSLLQAATSDPAYPDVHAFLAIVFYRNGLIDESSRELDRLDALDPPSQIRELTSGLRDKVEQARASTTTAAPAP